MAQVVRRKRGFKLSFQVLSLLVALSAVPWLGYQFISEAKQFLDAGQLISQEQFGRSVANTFYNKKESLTLSLAEGAPLPKTYLATPMTVDGSKQDWQDQSYRKVSFPQRQFYDGFSFSVAIGERNNSLYGLIEVRDVDPDYATGSLNGFGARDHVRLEWLNQHDAIERVVLVPQQDGFVAIFRVGPDWRRDTVDRFQAAPIEALMSPTLDGYVLEIKINKANINAKQQLRFSAYDGTTKSGVSSMGSTKGFHTLNTSSSVANQLLGRLAKSVSYIALYDTNFQLRAQSQVKLRQYAERVRTTVWQDVASVIEEAMMLLLHITMGIEGDESETQGELLRVAQLGDLAQARWSSLGGGGFLATAAPVLADDGNVIGIVLVKQSTDQILKLQLNSLQNIVLFSVAGILLIFSIVFFLFWRLAYRVRKLRIETANMVNDEGRLVASKIVGQVDREDSIGDLARSFSDVVSKLHEQQSFMSTMPRTLSHEIKNPLNAISTSLANMSDYPLDKEINSYLEIAKRGLHKIESILSKLSSAANLEQALTNDELEALDVNHFLTVYCQHQHQMAGSNVVIEYVANKKAAMVQAVDYRLEQALDKLLDNARDFHRSGTSIKVRLWADKFDWVIDVENQGDQVDLDKADQLFQSMVTSRTQASAGGAGHFGLGLYVVQTIAQFHKGTAQVANLADGSGVCFSIRLPASLI
ncbi:ATP-binding protein [Candidatus Njordibacter sp. Uisw_058]|uniref:ATP-binding protein n=1 Tax=Candidatus Njordibacter sp. Uisw_058 TaxID=3230974 RepID=UPI003D5D0707